MKRRNGASESDVSLMCLGVRYQLEALRNENGMLKKVLEDFRLEISDGKWKMNVCW